MRGDRSRRLVTACLVALSMAVIDQGTKALALAQLSEQERTPLVGDLFGMQLAFNPGTIMSFGSSSTFVFTVIGTVAVIALFYAAWRATSTTWAVAIGFVWGGAAGNLIDRLFAPPGFARGHVTDFLAYGNLFIGNIADVALESVSDSASSRCSAAANRNRPVNMQRRSPPTRSNLGLSR